MKDLINKRLKEAAKMIDRKDPLNLHSFIYTPLLKKKEITHELSGHALLNNLNREEDIMDNFEVGEYIVYQHEDTYGIGRVKSLREDGAFVYYRAGESAVKTPYDCMHKLLNGYCIKKTTLGGSILGDCIYADTDSVKERNSENAEG